VETLSAPVGSGQPNREHDVRLVQRLLDHQAGVTAARLPISGKFDMAMEMAIIRFQRQQMGLSFASGLVRPNDNTFWQLSQGVRVRMLAGALSGILLVPGSGKNDFDEEDFQRIASELFCEARTVKAVHAVESSHNAFDSMGRPPILFERHLFSALTFHQFDGRYP
jgi:hypothetical protein